MGKIGVTVVKGFLRNLEIMGQKKLTLNNGNDAIRLAALYDQRIFQHPMKLSSNRIAHASITYTGAGDLHDTNQPGWLEESTEVVPILGDFNDTNKNLFIHFTF